MTDNIYSVPTRKWSKWNEQAREVFNRTAGVVALNQDDFKHPKAATLNDDHWNTVAWNTAWIAADHTNESESE